MDNATLGEQIIFLEGAIGPNLWTSDGTEEGTYPIAERFWVELGATFEVAGEYFIACRTFRCRDDALVSDGTIKGTIRITPSTGVRFPDDIAFDEKLYFQNGSHLQFAEGNAVFRYEGLQPTARYENADWFVEWQGDQYFARNSATGSEIWKLGEGQLRGDLDQNGEVDLDDFVRLSDHFGQSELNAEGVDALAAGDVNGDGEVDFTDFLLLNHNFGRQLETIDPVPVDVFDGPPSLALVLGD